MCAIDIIETMAGINMLINKISLQQLDVVNQNNFSVLRKVNLSFGDGKEEEDIHLNGPDEATYVDIKSAFLKILSLLYKDKEKSNRSRTYSFLSILEDLIKEFPLFQKQPMDKLSEETINETIDIAKKENDFELAIKINVCKDIIFKS